MKNRMEIERQIHEHKGALSVVSSLWFSFRFMLDSFIFVICEINTLQAGLGMSREEIKLNKPIIDEIKNDKEIFAEMKARIEHSHVKGSVNATKVNVSTSAL